MALLRRGSKGPDIARLQEELNKVASIARPKDGTGWLATDGIYGPLTEGWVKTFQRNTGIKVDGICGPQTWSTLTEQVALHGFVGPTPPKGFKPPQSPSEEPRKPKQPERPPSQPPHSREGKRVATGVQALKLADELLAQCVEIRSSSGRRVLLEKGTFDKKTGIVVIGRLGDSVVYLKGDDLWLVPHGKFVNGLELGETAEVIVDRTRFIKSASEATMSTLLGFAIGFTGPLGSAAGVTVFVVKLMVFAEGRSPLINKANDNFGELIETLIWVHRNMPATAPHVRSIFWDGLQVDLWAAFSPKAIGPTFGKVLGMASGGKVGVPKTEFTFMKVVTLIATLIGTMAAEAGKTLELTVEPDDLKRAQSELKASLSEAEWSRMQAELAKPGAQEKLQQLAQLAHENVDFIKQVSNAVSVTPEAFPP